MPLPWAIALIAHCLNTINTSALLVLWNQSQYFTKKKKKKKDMAEYTYTVCHII